MPLFSKKDFAELCFTNTSDLSNYIRRGHVVYDEEKETIDSSDAKNAAFIVKRKQLQIQKTAKSVVIPGADADELNSRTAKKKTEVTPKFDFPPEMLHSVKVSAETDTKIKAATLEKTENEIRLQQMKIEKQKGELIPTQLVKDLIAQHSKSITVSFRNGAENFLMDITKKAGLTIEQVAELRGKLVEIINIAVNDSIDTSISGLENIVEEYTQQRGVGEKQ